MLSKGLNLGGGQEVEDVISTHESSGDRRVLKETKKLSMKLLDWTLNAIRMGKEIFGG